jgi:diguanylate cyclase (GGDEF)-like protein
MVAIRLDVSELVQREQELGLLNARLAQLNQELSVLSQTDALTGLANRRAFDQRLAEELSRVARHDVPLSLLVVDIDHFKSYNDHYGHPAGDACLRQVAEALRECAARPIDLVARLGGEEFALLLPHLDGADAVQVGERCLQAVEAAAIAHAGSPVAPRVTVSVGVAQSTQLEGDGAALLAAADAALYAAKRQRHASRGGVPSPDLQTPRSRAKYCRDRRDRGRNALPRSPSTLHSNPLSRSSRCRYSDRATQMLSLTPSP